MLKVGRFILGKLHISFCWDHIDIEKQKKEARDQAFREAIEVCKMWQKEVESTFETERLKGNFTSVGKLNLLALCVQRIEEKITGVRKWS